MDILLDEIEVRILGCLIEKEMTTPEYYPLSLNALTNACNQKSNRHPVFSLEESSVLKGVDALRQKGLARTTQVPGSRVTKYVHDLLSLFDLSRQEISVLCELMLRGPQTPGELRSNAGRIVPFAGIGEIEEVLGRLTDQDPPLVKRLPREAGRREARFSHLLSGENVGEEASSTALSEMSSQEKISKMEGEIAELRRELEQLRQAFSAFKSQF